MLPNTSSFTSSKSQTDTISLLYHQAMKGKTVRDTDDDYTENLYVICELAQELIKIWAHTHALNITTYPGKIKLPADILRPLANPDAANKILKTVYLSDQMLAWLKEQYSSTKDKKEKREKERAEKVPAKRKAPPKTNGNPIKRRRKRNSGHSEDDFGTDVSDGDAEPEGRSDPAGPDEEEDEDEPEASGEERLGRGQRTRAKKKQAKAASKKVKHSSPSPEG